MQTISKPDQRSIKIVSMFAADAIREMQLGQVFLAGRAIGSAQQAAVAIDDDATRERACKLMMCLERALVAK